MAAVTMHHFSGLAAPFVRSKGTVSGGVFSDPKITICKPSLRNTEVHLGRRKKLINNTDIPQHQIEAIARCILPDILAFYESEEGQREFSEWKKQREIEKQEAKTE